MSNKKKEVFPELKEKFINRIYDSIAENEELRKQKAERELQEMREQLKKLKGF